MYQLRSDHNAVVSTPKLFVSWTFDSKSRINGGLAVVNNRLYFDTLGGDVIALNVRTGSMIWRAHTDNDVMTTPVAEDGLVIVGSGKNVARASNSSFTYTSDPAIGATVWSRRAGDYILAYDALTGKLRWRYRTVGENMPSPVVVQRHVVFANGDFHAYGLDLRSGAAIWRTSLDGVSTMASGTAIGRNVVLVSVCRDFRAHTMTTALRLSDGKVIWKAPIGSCDSSPTFGGGQVFVSDVLGSKAPFGFGGRGVVAALDPANGRRLWTYVDAVGPYTSVGSSERAIAGVYAAGKYFQSIPSTDQVIAFDRKGRIHWRFGTVAPVKMSPVIFGRRVYFGDIAGLFYVLNADNGALRDTLTFDQSFSTSPPIIIGQTLFVANGTSVNAIPLSGGNV